MFFCDFGPVFGGFALVLMNTQTDGRTDGRMDRQLDGWMNGRTDGRTNPHIEMRGHI